VLKADFHTHTADDPHDAIPYDAFELVDRAAALGYSALGITLHDRQAAIDEVADYGRRRGVIVISGIERTIRGKHVLLLNFSRAAENVETFEDVGRLKAEPGGVVIAPHPFYPMPSCLGRSLDRHADLFDAVEINAFYLRSCNFNRRAIEWARRHGKPMVGNADVHRLSQLGSTYSLVDAAPDPDAICEAIRAGRVEVRTAPLTAARAAALFGALVIGDLVRRSDARGLPRERRPISPASLLD
jgi:predicted metal-dependent phosphoesterase TrpH